MMYGLEDHKLLQQEYNERLKNAEQERFARRFQANQPSFLSRARQGIGQVLVAAGQKLKAQGQPTIIPQV
jgi:hypothetical protein